MKRTIDFRAFKDNQGNECSISESAFEDDCIWIGFDDDQYSAHVHLTRDMVRELIPVLQNFVDRKFPSRSKESEKESRE